jgi:glutathione S-transferase
VSAVDRREPRPADRLYHLALPGDWAAARDAGSYRISTQGATLDEVGFIHCSFAHQLDATDARFYGDLDEVLVLEIDPSRLDDDVRVEDLHGTGEEFPHLYGPLPVGAVVAVRHRARGDGSPA